MPSRPSRSGRTEANRPFPERGRATLELGAIADRFNLYADEAAYRATGTPMAVASLIPSGMFSVGSPDPDGFQVHPVALISGTVMAAEVRRHALFDVGFAVVRVASLGAEFAACLDLADLGGADAALLPSAGSIISGQFYLSGRVRSAPELEAAVADQERAGQEGKAERYQTDAPQ